MIAIYCRISKDRESQKSIKEQRLQGIEYAERNNLAYKVYTDEDISGGALINDRPAFKEMLSDLASGLIDTLWFYDQSRWERDQYTKEVTLQQLNLYNGRLILGGIEQNINDPQTRFNLSVTSAANELYRLQTAEKIQKVLLRNAKEGRVHSITPYGYTKDENKFLVVDEVESSVVKRIFGMSLSGMGTDAIAEFLNNEGIHKTRRGAKWRGKTIQDIIKNPIHKGERRWQDSTFPAPATMSPEYWQQVNDNLRNNANNRGKKETYNYLLKHLLICGKCGRNYYGKIKKDKEGRYTDYYYQCSSRRRGYETCGNRGIHIGKIEQFVWGRFIDEGELLERIREHFKKSSTSTKVGQLKFKINLVEKEIRENEKSLSNLLDAVQTGLLSAELIKSRSVSIEANRKQFEAELNNLKEQLLTYTSTDELDRIASELGGVNNLSFNDKRTLLKKYLCPIYVRFLDNQYYLHIGFNIPDMTGVTYVVSKDWGEVSTLPVPIERGAIDLSNTDFITDEALKRNSTNRV